jgi:hypothetical protein
LGISKTLKFNYFHAKVKQLEAEWKCAKMESKMLAGKIKKKEIFIFIVK